MRTETNKTTTSRPSTFRKPSRVEQPAPSHIVEAPAAPAAEAPALEPEIAAKIAKEEERLKKAQAEAARRQARIDAYKAGKPIPPASSKGLPPVVKMNELGALARNLHRAYLTVVSGAAEIGHSGDETVSMSLRVIAELRDQAIDRWTKQHAARAAAGAAENDTLHPLGLEPDAEGRVALIEKVKKSE